MKKLFALLSALLCVTTFAVVGHAAPTPRFTDIWMADCLVGEDDGEVFCSASLQAYDPQEIIIKTTFYKTVNRKWVKISSFTDRDNSDYLLSDHSVPAESHTSYKIVVNYECGVDTHTLTEYVSVD